MRSFPVAPNGRTRDRPTQTCSIINCLVGQHGYLTVEIQASGRMQLCHENHDHLFFWIDRKSGVEKSRPIIFSGRAEFGEWHLHSVHAKAQSKATLRTDLP